MVKIFLKNVNLEIPVIETESSKRSFVSNFFVKKFAFNNFNKNNTFHALKDISLEIVEGDRIGIIGLNGAGKTTLLRTLAGIYPPTTGNIYVEGQIMNLLSITGGSHPELTGIENIKALLNYRRISPDEQERLIPLIIEFSELAGHLHKPIKTYSSGMGLRLCFSVVTSLNPEILLMDEWLSVGDLSFLKKAQNKIKSLVNSSKIVVIGSHNLDLLREVTNKTIYIKNGRIIQYDITSKVLSTYCEENG